MTSRERMMIALQNGRPDRLPCQSHGWMRNWLDLYRDGGDQWDAYEWSGMDFAIYVGPDYTFDQRDLADWEVKRVDLGKDADGNNRWEETITTPKGTLHAAGASNNITNWRTEPLLKTEQDFEIWNEFVPVPAKVEFHTLQAARERLGDRGIIRVHPYAFGQGSPWQSFCILFDSVPAIMLAMDRPGFVHHALETMLQKTVRTIEMWEGIPADMIETGGGAGSSTVISPKLHAEFCTPYDRREHEALHAVGLKVVYHLCGGLMPLLDLVAQNGCDGMETMTPPSMGGDCDLAEASRRVGDRLFFIGGFDQNAGFENGTPQDARRLVHECFEATRDHAGYIIAPSDHFFVGDPANVRAFADAAKECVY